MDKKASGISDEFWSVVEPLVPTPARKIEKQYKRRHGAGRKPLEARRVFEAIIYVLRTGIQWKSLPKQLFGSSSSIHAYFKEWERQGFFIELWERGLTELDEMKGVSWEWHPSGRTEKRFSDKKTAEENDNTSNTKKQSNSRIKSKKLTQSLRKKSTSAPCSSGRDWRPVAKRRVRLKVQQRAKL